jgi:crotonobetainyl-CoA:carnitine CoA-transferase CaiB-like acyl-CoA transferase
VNNAPRNVYRTADDRWVAVSTSSQSIAERVMRLVGRPEFIDEPWFATGAGRVAHADELDAAVGDWIAQRSIATVTEEFERADAAIAPIYDVRDIIADQQFAALGTIATIADDDWKQVRMQNQLFRLSETAGSIRWTGRPPGHDTDELLAEIGIEPAEVERLRQTGVV